MVRKRSQKYSVIPMETGETWMEPQDSVGRAQTLTEARRLVKDAGYRIMWEGGLHELTPGGAIGEGKEDYWTITVWPSR